MGENWRRLTLSYDEIQLSYNDEIEQRDKN